MSFLLPSHSSALISPSLLLIVSPPPPLVSLSLSVCVSHMATGFSLVPPSFFVRSSAHVSVLRLSLESGILWAARPRPHLLSGFPLAAAAAVAVSEGEGEEEEAQTLTAFRTQFGTRANSSSFAPDIHSPRGNGIQNAEQHLRDGEGTTNLSAKKKGSN